MYKLYEQLLPTKLYTSKKTKTSPTDNVMSRLRGKCPELAFLAGCSAVAQKKYQESLESVIFFELLRDLKLIDSVPPWYSPVQPKSLFENEDVQAYWDIPMFAGIS